MTLYVLPALFALFAWWFSTGAIMYLDGLPQRTFRWSLLGATAVFGLSLWGLRASSESTTIAAAYWAFTWGLLAWGWQEISFYMGYVTGPRRQACPDGCRGWAHFGHAIQTSLWHELAIVASGAAVVALTWHGANQVGTWTFMVLWWMHQSAKLNVFLGVRNLNEEFLPDHLQFLRSFLTKRPMNLLFPISITVSTVILVLLAQRAAAPGVTRFEAAGFAFLSVLMGLAILEHWFLVLPLPAARLWGWSLKSRQATKPFAVEVVSGFLGAGKTTFLRARLAAAGPRTVVLVNDFAAVGVDGSLLRGQGADVVELPNGCICCSLKNDLARQLTDMAARFAPDRVLIEPSGVADLASLLAVLGQPALAPLVRTLGVTTVVDAGAFLHDYARRAELLRAQVRPASLLVVNKADLASPATLRTIDASLRTINPAAAVVTATFGQAADPAAVQPIAATLAAEPAHAHHDHDHPHRHHHQHDAADEFASWDVALPAEPCDPDLLLAVLEQVAAGRFGAVERLKGLARSGAGWLRFDVAGGRPFLAAFDPADGETARAVAIGSALRTAQLAAALEGCFEEAATVAFAA